MTTPQRKLSSGFGQRSTARDVVAGLDLSGDLAIVTGGYSGLGIETVAALAGGGAHLIVPARRTGVAWDALQARGLGEVEVEERLAVWGPKQVLTTAPWQVLPQALPAGWWPDCPGGRTSG